MKKETKEKGVTDRIRHFKAPRIRISIRIIVSESKMKPPSPYLETPKTLPFSNRPRWEKIKDAIELRFYLEIC